MPTPYRIPAEPADNSDAGTPTPHDHRRSPPPDPDAAEPATRPGCWNPSSADTPMTPGGRGPHPPRRPPEPPFFSAEPRPADKPLSANPPGPPNLGFGRRTTQLSSGGGRVSYELQKAYMPSPSAAAPGSASDALAVPRHRPPRPAPICDRVRNDRVGQRPGQLEPARAAQPASDTRRPEAETTSAGREPQTPPTGVSGCATPRSRRHEFRTSAGVQADPRSGFGLNELLAPDRVCRCAEAIAECCDGKDSGTQSNE